MGDAGFEPGTYAPEVWCAANEPPHLQTKEPPHLQNEPLHLRINSVPQTDATTFAFASVSFLFLWLQLYAIADPLWRIQQ